MTKAEAHRLLDAARAGAAISSPLIAQALAATGDLCWHVLHAVEKEYGVALHDPAEATC